MVSSKTVLGIIDRLVAERGEKKNGVYRLIITTHELMEAFGLKPSIPHHRYIKGIVEMHYHGTRSETIGKGDGSQGFRLSIKVWSK